MNFNFAILICAFTFPTFIKSQTSRKLDSINLLRNGNENEAITLLRRLLRLEEMQVSTTTKPNERSPINLSIIVVPVLHEKASGSEPTGQNAKFIEGKSKLPQSANEDAEMLGDRMMFPDDDEEDLEAEESSNFANYRPRPASTPAPGIVNPTHAPSCPQGMVFDSSLGQCVRNRPASSPIGGRRPRPGGRRRRVGTRQYNNE